MQFKEEGKLLEAQRLEMRVNYDLEMLETMGFCSGIENYSRHLDGRAPGEPPYTLIDYFPKDFLCIIDESHEMCIRDSDSAPPLPAQSSRQR